MSRAYVGLARTVSVLAALNLALIGFAHDWGVHEARTAGPVDATSLTNNAGDGLGWLTGFVLTPLCALTLVVVGAALRDRTRLLTAVVVAGLVILAAVLGEAGRSVPAFGAVHAGVVMAAGLLAWRSAAGSAQVRAVTALAR